jgi:hypothetical protein
MFADSAFIGAHVFLIEKVRKIFNATLTPTFFVSLPRYPITRLLSVMDAASTARGCKYYYCILKLKIG